MSEAISFAVGVEVPLVLVDVQRGGPSTGVPTRSEQSDLFQAVFGGHGDAPRVVLAPHDSESLLRLTHAAFNISEQYQTPVIVLSDQSLGQSSVIVPNGFLKAEYPVVDRQPLVLDGNERYQRYCDTPNGISPMANIGDPGGVYQTSGLSHGPDGSHDPSHAAVEWWHDKITRKLKPLETTAGLVKTYGSLDGTNVIIAWGSSAQVALTALKQTGLVDHVMLCVPEIISPLPEEVRTLAAKADRLLVVELNHQGQYYRYLRGLADLPKTSMSHCRSGAQPFGVGELSEVMTRFFDERQSRP